MKAVKINDIGGGEIVMYVTVKPSMRLKIRIQLAFLLFHAAAWLIGFDSKVNVKSESKT